MTQHRFRLCCSGVAFAFAALGCAPVASPKTASSEALEPGDQADSAPPEVSMPLDAASVRDDVQGWRNQELWVKP